VIDFAFRKNIHSNVLKIKKLKNATIKQCFVQMLSLTSSPTRMCIEFNLRLDPRLILLEYIFAQLFLIRREQLMFPESFELVRLTANQNKHCPRLSLDMTT